VAEAAKAGYSRSNLSGLVSTSSLGRQKIGKAEAPNAYGYNVIQAEDLHPQVRLSIRAATADAGSLQAIAVRQTGSQSFAYTPLAVAGKKQTIVLQDVAPEEKVYLVVAATPDRVNIGRSFPYDYEVDSQVY